MPRIMDTEEVTLIIKEKNNPGLNSLLAKSKLFKGLRPIGFAAIPAGFLGAICLTSNKPSDGRSQEAAFLKQNAGASFLAIAAACFSSGVYFTIQSKKNYKKAVQKYNQLYN